MALDRDKMLAAIAGGGRVPINKQSVANTTAGQITSLWRAVGTPLWNQGAIPTTASTPTDATTGGIALPTFTGTTGRVYRFAPLAVTAGTFMLYDRLAHMGGLSGTTASPTAQTVNLDVTTALASGRTTANEVEWYVEIYTDIGTTASNLTVTYTDVNDVGSKTIVLTGFTGASPLNRSGRCVKLVPTDGVQIKSIQSATLSVTSGTAGNFGFTARKLLTSVGQLTANILSPSVDAISIGLPEIKDSSCLEMLVLPSTTSTGIIYGDLVWGQVNET